MDDQSLETPDWDTVPDDQKLRILSLVPTSKSKLLLRTVSSSWNSLLSSPSAYSSSLEECEDLDTRTVPDAWTSVLRPLRALSLYSSWDSPDLTTLGHLPISHLEALRVRVDHLSTLTACQQMPNLTRLELDTDGVSGDALAMIHCPALRQLRISTVDALAEQIVPRFGELPNLTSLEYVSDWISDVKVPAGCEVSAQFSGDLPKQLPENVAQHLVSLKLTYLVHPWLDHESTLQFDLDLSPLSSCQHLRRLALIQDWELGGPEPWGNDAPEGYVWGLRGLEAMPASLTCFTVLGAAMPAVSSAAVESYADGEFQLTQGLPLHDETEPEEPTIAYQGLLTTLHDLPTDLTEL